MKTVFRRHPDYFRPGLAWVDGVDWLVMEDDAAGLAAYRTGQLDAGPWHFWTVRQAHVAAIDYGNRAAALWLDRWTNVLWVTM